MCSSGGQIAKTDQDLQQSQANFTNLLSKNYQIAFKQQQLVLAQQQARLNNMVANPLGYSPTQLHLAKTSINENTATAAKQALGAASAFAAAHGASDVAGSGAAQAAGTIAADLSSTKAKMLADLSGQNEELKRQNFLTALEGLNQVGSEYGAQGGQAVGSESGVAESGVNAGKGALEAKQADWKNFGSVVSGVAGLVAAPFTGGASLALLGGGGASTRKG